MNREVLLSKFLGSIIGAAVGDVLGAPFEGSQKVQANTVYTVAEDRPILTYTDDTHMMIGVAESLIAKKGFDGAYMSKRFSRNYFDDPYRGYGQGPPLIFKKIEAGTPWEKAAEEIYPGGSYGNGSAMRIAPIGLYYYDDLHKLKEAVFQSSQITHAHILGKEGAMMQAYAVSLVLSQPSKSSFRPKSFLKKLQSVVTRDIYKKKLGIIANLLGTDDKKRVIFELGNGIEAFNSVPAAIFSFLSHPKSFEDAVVYAVSLGGDTDTIGSMTGAISGAFLGIEAIPQKWRAKIENNSYLTELALKLCDLKGS